MVFWECPIGALECTIWGTMGAISQGIFLEFSSKEGVEVDFEELRAKKKKV